MNQASPELADDALMQRILADAEADSTWGVEAIDRALIDHPLDPRLQFLKGSLLIGLKRFVEAHDALSRAIEIAPDFALARFQLGFFELTSGEAEGALETWRPLHGLPTGHWLLSFVQGLEHLIADRFEACIAALRQGIAENTENLPLNHDMELIIEKCWELLAPQPDAELAGGEVSATSLLLRSTGVDGAKR
jgi:tetratricopeptide (TPR) repeat protein